MCYCSPVSRESEIILVFFGMCPPPPEGKGGREMLAIAGEAARVMRASLVVTAADCKGRASIVLLRNGLPAPDGQDTRRAGPSTPCRTRRVA